jgi:hypothetical protein
MNENYELALEHDPDFDKPHKYTKSYGDGSPRGYCRCLRLIGDEIHDVKEDE